MALDEKARFYSPVMLGSGSQAVIWDDGAPDGSIAPQSDAAKGSLYLRNDMTTDQSGMYVKVDTANADDDWVRAAVDKDEGSFTWEGDHTWGTSKKVYFRDTGLYIYSPADTHLQISVDGMLLVSGGSGLLFEGDAQVYQNINFGPHLFRGANASVVAGAQRHTSSACYPVLQFATCDLGQAYPDVFKVPTDAASSGSVQADVIWAACTDGDAAVFLVGYDYIATAEGAGTCSGSVIMAGSCVAASNFTATTIGNLPSFTQGDYVALRVEHDGTSACDDSGSTTDMVTLVLRYVADRVGATTG